MNSATRSLVLTLILSLVPAGAAAEAPKRFVQKAVTWTAEKTNVAVGFRTARLAGRRIRAVYGAQGLSAKAQSARARAQGLSAQGQSAKAQSARAQAKALSAKARILKRLGLAGIPDGIDSTHQSALSRMRGMNAVERQAALWAKARQLAAAGNADMAAFYQRAAGLSNAAYGRLVAFILGRQDAPEKNLEPSRKSGEEALAGWRSRSNRPLPGPEVRRLNSMLGRMRAAEQRREGPLFQAFARGARPAGNQLRAVWEMSPSVTVASR